MAPVVGSQEAAALAWAWCESRRLQAQTQPLPTQFNQNRVWESSQPQSAPTLRALPTSIPWEPHLGETAPGEPPQLWEAQGRSCAVLPPQHKAPCPSLLQVGSRAGKGGSSTGKQPRWDGMGWGERSHTLTGKEQPQPGHGGTVPLSVPSSSPAVAPGPGHTCRAAQDTPAALLAMHRHLRSRQGRPESLLPWGHTGTEGTGSMDSPKS